MNLKRRIFQETDMPFITEIKTFAALGSGVIGSGWVARALAHGLDVVAWDPAPGAEPRCANVSPTPGRRWKTRPGPGASQDRLKFVATIEECVRDADFIQESAPERLDLKLDLHAKISAAAKPTPSSAPALRACCPASSTSRPPTLNAAWSATRSTRCTCCRWWKSSAATAPRPKPSRRRNHLHRPRHAPAACAQGSARLHRRPPARSAVARGLHLVNDGVATTGEIDDAIRFGAGLRWSFMGTFLTYTLAGGDAGMRHFMAQFGPALQLPWTYLPAPELTDKLIDDVVDGTSEQLGERSIAALERYRDDTLLAVLEAVKTSKAKHGMAFGD
jgi:carnitine 3-dehydrogenase